MVFTVVFGQYLAKTLVFTDVSPYNKMGFLNPKKQTYCKLQCFESALGVRRRRGGRGVEEVGRVGGWGEWGGCRGKVGGWGGVEGEDRGGTKITSNFLNNQVTGLAALPFTS